MQPLEKLAHANAVNRDHSGTRTIGRACGRNLCHRDTRSAFKGNRFGFGPGLRYGSPAPVDEFGGGRAVAQFGSARDWGSRGRRFKSCQPDNKTGSDAKIQPFASGPHCTACRSQLLHAVCTALHWAQTVWCCSPPHRSARRQERGEKGSGPSGRAVSPAGHDGFDRIACSPHSNVQGDPLPRVGLEPTTLRYRPQPRGALQQLTLFDANAVLTCTYPVQAFSLLDVV
jgi:hypothetical protein